MISATNSTDCLALMRIFADSTDQVWKAFGKDEPYFGVLSYDKYSRERLSSSALEEFFQSGEDALAALMSSIGRQVIEIRRDRALDFGCGVGRLTIPLAKRCSETIGVDVSEGMLAECRKNLAQRHVNNVLLSHQIPDLKFDLIHSALVFQHINRVRGHNLILDCWSKVAVGGLLAVQLPIRYNGTWTNYQLRRVRNAVPILQIPYNLLRSRPWNRPGRQMNVCDLNVLSASLLEAGATAITLLRQISDRSFDGVYLLAVKEFSRANPATSGNSS